MVEMQVKEEYCKVLGSGDIYACITLSLVPYFSASRRCESCRAEVDDTVYVRGVQGLR